MSHNVWISICSGLLLALSLSCGKTKGDKVAETSESCFSRQMMLLGDQCVPRNGDTGTMYRTYLMDQAPFIQSLSKDSVEFCILTQSDDPLLRDKLEKGTKKAYSAWIEPLKFVSENLPLVMNFQFHLVKKEEISREHPTQNICQKNTDVTIIHFDNLKQIFGEDRAFAVDNTIWLSNNHNSDQIILHEFGHIMGLLDTYTDGGSICRKGFSKSIMCVPSIGSLQAEDWVGAQRSYCLQTNGTHPNCFNHEKKELLSFQPSSSSFNDISRQESYFFCSNKKFNLNFFAFRFAIESIAGDNFSTNDRFGLLSTDSRSVSELYSDNGFEFSFNLDPKHLKDYSDRTEMDTIKLKMAKNSLAAYFPYKGQWQDEIFTDCAFDEKTAAYLSSKNIDVSSSFISNQDYMRLLKRVRVTESRFHNGTYSISTEIKSRLPLELESVSVYAGENHTLLTKKRFDEIAKIIEKTDTTIRIEIDMSQVPPSPEYLELFVEGQGTTLVHMKLKKNTSARID